MQRDQEKVNFITSDGTFCYIIMSFGLKNAGVAYQRLINRVFKNQMGRNIEIYVDDIVVKSTRAEDLIGDIEEIFVTLQRYGLKLNLNKCIFGVRSGKYLSYMVTERGIKVNPEKV